MVPAWFGEMSRDGARSNCQTHNLKVVGSNPAPETKETAANSMGWRRFQFYNNTYHIGLGIYWESRESKLQGTPGTSRQRIECRLRLVRLVPPA